MSMFGMTDDLKVRLVQEIYQRPLIWKPSDPRYTDVPARWVAFEEVAQALSDKGTVFSSDMIKMAWKNMTDYYNHIRRRNDRARAAGLNPPVAKWHFFNMLHFIRQEKTPAKRKYNWLEPSKIASSDSWMNDSDLTIESSPATVPQNNEYDSGNVDNLPRPIPIRPPLGAFEANRPRTKQSERAKLQARREALRDANLSTHSDRGITLSGGSPIKTPKRALAEREAAMRKRVRDMKGRFARKDGSLSNRSDMKPDSKRVSKRGRKLVKRRLSISPSPPRTPLKNPPPNKRGRTISVSPLKQEQRTSSSLRKQPRSDSPLPKPCSNSAPSALKPISALDSTSYFARAVAARLYMIKAESPSEYSNVCEKINEALRNAESALGIKPIDG